jgi:hypothetical protein
MVLVLELHDVVGHEYYHFSRVQRRRQCFQVVCGTKIAIQRIKILCPVAVIRVSILCILG